MKKHGHEYNLRLQFLEPFTKRLYMVLKINELKISNLTALILQIRNNLENQ